jgi:hypothetical protein
LHENEAYRQSGQLTIDEMQKRACKKLLGLRSQSWQDIDGSSPMSQEKMSHTQDWIVPD